MKNLNYLYIVIGLGLSFFSCKKEVSPPPQYPDKVVVSCFISPDDTDIEATLSLSKAKYGVIVPENTVGSNATVTIQNNNGAVLQLLWNNAKQKYSIAATPNFLQEGQTYRLDVEVPNYGSVTAYTSIPEKITNASLDFVSNQMGVRASTNLESYFESYLKLKVPSALKDNGYYVFYAKREFKDVDVLVNGVAGVADVVGYSTSYLQENSTSIDRVLSVKIARVLTDGEYKNPQAVKLSGYFVSCSKDYYRYYQTTVMKKPYDESPFSSPVVIYSNIEGGYGIFAGYNQVIQQVTTP